MLSEWAVVALVTVILAGAVGLVFLGAWIGFRVRTVGTGTPFIQPTTPKADMTHRSSYVADLLKDVDGVDILQEEPLSPAAKRIRDQKFKGPLADVMREVEGR